MFNLLIPWLDSRPNNLSFAFSYLRKKDQVTTTCCLHLGRPWLVLTSRPTSWLLIRFSCASNSSSFSFPRWTWVFHWHRDAPGPCLLLKHIEYGLNHPPPPPRALGRAHFEFLRLEFPPFRVTVPLQLIAEQEFLILIVGTEILFSDRFLGLVLSLS